MNNIRSIFFFFKRCWKSLFKKQFLQALFLTPFLWFTTHSLAKESPSLEQIRERGYLRIGVFVGTKAFGYLSPEGERSGFDIDIAKYLAKEMFGDENKIEYINTLAVDRAAALKSGKVDIVIANYSDTKRRRRAVDFAEPYVRSRLAIVGANALRINGIQDLANKKILVFKGSTAEQYFEDHHPNFPLERRMNVADTYKELKENTNAVLVNDNLILYRWLKDNEGYEIKMIFDESVYSAPAVDKGNKELLAWVNQSMRKMKSEGLFKVFYQRNMAEHYGSHAKAEDVIAQ